MLQVKPMFTWLKVNEKISASMPDGFYSTVTKKVLTIDKEKGKGSTKNVETYNTELVYS